MQPPFNVPPVIGAPTMDGFAVDYYANFCWEKGRAPTEAEMRAIGGMFTLETAPVINRLAAEFAVFTRWFCEVPKPYLPEPVLLPRRDQPREDRQRECCLLRLGPGDAESLRPANRQGNRLAGLLRHEPDCAGLRDQPGRPAACWHVAEPFGPAPSVLRHAAAGRLPACLRPEPNMLFPPLDDYHPVTDIRAGEQFLARVFQAVRDSPQWPQTALIVLFDEHGGCYDHVPPSAAPVPDDHPGEQGFGFDRFGLRVPALVVSPYTERGTVIDQDFHTCSVLRTLRERFGLGPALSRRDAAAPLLLPAFNRSAPRDDHIDLTVPAYHYQPPNGQQRAAARGDAPDAWLLAGKWARADAGELSQLAWWTLRERGPAVW